MVIADTLSRYSPEDTPEILLDISVNHVYIDGRQKIEETRLSTRNQG